MRRSLRVSSLAPLLLLVACAHEEPLDGIGSSHTAMSAPPERADAGPTGSDPQLPARWRESFVHLGELGASRGHGTGDWPTSVYADASGARALNERETAPAGATLVAILPSKTGELLFIMQKSAETSADGGGGDARARWHYRVRDASGVTLDPPACDSCHAQAPHDRLFILAADAGR
jgi:hypothetical protein